MAYNTNYKTFLARSKGQLLRITYLSNSYKLITIEEKTLEDWILSLDIRYYGDLVNRDSNTVI
jgi:hypothetical protein